MGSSLQLNASQLNAAPLTGTQQHLLRQAIQDGLPLTPQPYQTLATALGVSELAVMETLQDWTTNGLIKRFGLVVKHHALGYRANAMVVWDVPDHQVDAIGDVLSKADPVTLCYQRPRRLPEWRYNLFTMIHGKSRSMVLEQLAELIEAHELDAIPRDVLFSYRLFKQCGGHYSSCQPNPHSQSETNSAACEYVAQQERLKTSALAEHSSSTRQVAYG